MAKRDFPAALATALAAELNKILEPHLGKHNDEGLITAVQSEMNEFLHKHSVIPSVTVTNLVCAPDGKVTFKVSGLERVMRSHHDHLDPPYVRYCDEYGVVHWTGAHLVLADTRAQLCDSTIVEPSYVDFLVRGRATSCIQCLAWEMNRG